HLSRPAHPASLSHREFLKSSAIADLLRGLGFGPGFGAGDEVLAAPLASPAGNSAAGPTKLSLKKGLVLSMVSTRLVLRTTSRWYATQASTSCRPNHSRRAQRRGDEEGRRCVEYPHFIHYASVPHFAAHREGYLLKRIDQQARTINNGQFPGI